MRRYSKFLIASLVVLISAWLILLRAQIAGPNVNTWIQVGNLAAARAAACSVPLPDGRVLVAGGSSATGSVHTVDILGTNGAFTAGPPMLEARANAACALLQDGRVFVSGGTDGTKALASAEIFTPSTNVWTSVGSMNVARYGHTATVTQMGAVLLVGGQSDRGVTAQIEAFRPANGTFLSLGAMSSPRSDYAVTVVDKHHTLIAGGTNGSTTLNTIDIFDSSTNAITASGAMHTARHGFAAVTLLDGTVMFAGGYGTDGTALATTEIYDPATQTSVAGPPMSGPRASHLGMVLPGNGAVILFGGTDGTNTLSATDLYQPWTGKFASQAPMNTARTGLAGALLRTGSVVAAGGRNSNGYVAGAEAYNFATAGTDEPDYHPGQVAKMSGAGFKPGESVAFTVTAFPVDKDGVEFTGTAVADPTGRVTLTGFNIDKSHANVKFLLDVAGSQSHAETTFTDSTDATSILSTTVSPNPLVAQPWGTSVTFDGQILDTSNGAHIPTGSVSIYDNNISVTSPLSVTYPAVGGSGVLAGGDYAITVNPSDPAGILNPGSHVFTIEYAGDTSGGNTYLAAANVTVNYVISPVNTLTAFTFGTTDQTISYGQQATLTAVVTTQEGPGLLTYGEPPQGAFVFQDTLTPYACTATPTYGPSVPLGLAVNQTQYQCLTSVTLPQGDHQLKAEYSGCCSATLTWEPSQSSDIRHVFVNTIATNTAIVPNLSSPQTYPQAITLTATVTPASGGGSTAGGSVTFFDGTNALCGQSYTLTGSPGSITSCSFVLTGGSHSLSAQFSNVGATNYANSTSGTLPYLINAAATNSSIGLSVPTPESFGTSETFTATVTCAGCAPPTGSVNFFDTQTGLNINPSPITLVNSLPNSATATYTTSALAGGNHSIEVVYSSSNTNQYANSTSAPATYFVNGIQPTFSISSLPASPTAFQNITFTVTASPIGGHTPTGNVQLVIDSVNQGASVVLNNGSVQFTIAGGLTAATHTLAINYTAGVGEVSFVTTPNASLTPNSIGVVKSAVTVTVTANQTSPMLYGTPITITATVKPADPTVTGTPTGTANFADAVAGTFALNQTLINGAVSLGVSDSVLTPAAHTLTAQYNGDPNFTTGSSVGFPLIVNLATTTTSLSANFTSINLGQSVQYTVSVAGTPPTAGNPAGSVTISDNGVAITACSNLTLSNANPATVSCTVAYNGSGGLGGGSHSITAAYTAAIVPQVFANSNATPITVTVNQTSTSIGPLTVLIGNPAVTLWNTTTPPFTVVYNNSGAPPILNIPFTFGASTPVATGNFQVYDGGTLLGNVPANSTSPATFNLPASVYQTVGAHTLQVKYPGDSNYVAASSPTISYITAKYAPTVSSSGFATGVFGTAVTLGGTVNVGGAAGAAAATGTLTFTIGTTTLGQCTLTAGTCTLSVTNAALVVPVAPATSDTINIAYSGDANYSNATGTGTITPTMNTVTGSLATSPSGNAAFGSSVQLIATFPATSGIGVPTGSVTFYDLPPGASTPTALATVTLTPAGATLTTSSLVPGLHNLYASYSGDTNFSAVAQVNGPTRTITINTGGMTVTLTPSANPASLNQTITYNFGVQGGPTPPTGTVTLTDAISGGPVTIPSCNLSALTPASGNSSTGSCQVTYNATDAIHGSGSHLIVANYVPTLGSTNWAAASSNVLTEVVGQITPLISQPTASPAPGNYGVPLTYSVTMTPVNPTPAYAPASVQFYDNGLPLGGPVNVTAATGVASYGPTVPAGGTHTITAQFNGDTNYAASALSAKYVFTIGKATPTVTVLTPPTSAQYVSQISTGLVTVAVPGGNSGITPTGSVMLIAGTTTLATGTLSSGGTYTFLNIQLPPSLTVNNSPYNLYVQYSGDGNWAATPSSGTSLAITPTAAPVTVTSANIPPAVSANPIYGQTLLFTATFNGPGNPVAGNVTFQNNNANILGCVSVVVANNLATCSVSNLPATIDSVTVTNLTNDANHSLGTVTGTGNFTVNPDPTVTALTSSPNPSLPGQTVVFTATVTVPAPGVGTAGSLTGTVTFVLNGSPAVNLCTNVPLSGTVTGSTAGCTVAAGTTSPFNNFGPYAITATYTPGSGEKTVTSTSAVYTQQVSKPAPVFQSLISNANPSVYGQAVTFTVTFALPAGSSTAPTGTIQFYDGANSLGGLQNIAPSGGGYTSSITIPNTNYTSLLSGGQHIISAVYVPGSNDNYSSGNSATQQPTTVTLNQQVNQATVTITPGVPTYLPGITGAPVYGEQITYTAVIAPSGSNGGIPTGQAIFKLAGTQFGPLVNLVTSGGLTTATITYSANGLPNLPAGSDTITVSYLGDQNFAPTSQVTPTAFQPVTIGPAPTITTLAQPTTPSAYGTNLTLTATVCAQQINPSIALTCGSMPTPGLKGTVTFYDGSTVLNPGGTPVPVISNTASITITLTSGPLMSPAVGSHSITATYNGGGATDPNFASSTSTLAQPDLSVVKGPTVTLVSSSNNPSVIGQAVTLTVQVSDAGSFAAVPTGTVAFYDGGLQIGTGILAPGGANVATAALTVPIGGGNPFILGQHVISVVYSGDANYTNSATPVSPPCSGGVTTSCALVQVVNQAATTTTISSNQNSSTVGQQVTLTAQIQVVPPGAAVLAGPSAGPTGTVIFSDNVGALQNVLGQGIVTRTVVAGSTLYIATLTLTNAPQGQTAITAAYSGDQNYAASTSQPLTQSVNKISSNATISSSLNPSILGQPVTFTITISPTPPGQGVPTGAVTLMDGSALLANIQLVGGQATYTASLPTGGHGLIVTYQGDANFQGVVSGTLTQTVNKIPSSLNLTTSVTSGAVASQVITFTAQIQPTPQPGVPYPQGQIAFFMDGTTLGVASLASGVATLSTTLPAGNHQINASYSGDLNYTNSQSSYLQQVVGTAGTTTLIVSSVNPSVFGQPVVVTVTVAVPYPGTVPATGTVQLYDNGNALGNPLPANNGTFSTTLTALAPGTHNIIAQFQANGSFSQSSSAALSQIVNKAPTVTTLGAFPGSSTSNQAVVLTAVVSVPSPGAGTPTGTVQFVNTTTSTVLGSAPLNLIGGVYTATLSTSALAQGSQTQLLTATYSGDGNFATSTSAPYGQSVFGTELTVTNAAGYTTSNFAPDSFASIFGQNLAYTALTAVTTPLPTSLSGTTVMVTDSAGIARLAPLYYVSLPQIDFVIPASTAYGLATVTVTNASGETASTTILITVTAPGLYSQNMSGQGVAAGYVVTVHADGTQSAQVPLFQYNPNTQQYVPVPIVWNNSTDQQYLVLYGTGFDKGTTNNTTATINGIAFPVIYVGQQPQFAAEDQVNLGPIPQSLKGSGTVNVVITVNGQQTNAVTVQFQ